MDPDVFRDHLRKIEKNLAMGSAAEHTHRLALKALLEAIGQGGYRSQRDHALDGRLTI